VARGEVLFNTKPIQITGVSGLNDELGQPLIVGTCTTCHNNPNVGNHTMRRSLNIGVTDEAERTPDLPLYTLERLDAQGEPTGELKKTTDPGRAMISGKWEDIGRFKGPVLRGLAARAPYFHNGLAATLGDAVDFYDRRFEVGFTDQEKADLVAFLRAL
jgi:cytochrome c peroxidase